MCSTHTGGKASCAHSPHVLAFSFALSTQINIPAHRLPRPMHLPRLPRASCVSRVPLHLRLPRLLSPASVVFPAPPALASAALLTTLPAWPTRSHTHPHLTHTAVVRHVELVAVALAAAKEGLARGLLYHLHLEHLAAIVGVHLALAPLRARLRALGWRGWSACCWRLGGGAWRRHSSCCIGDWQQGCSKQEWGEIMVHTCKAARQWQGHAQHGAWQSMAA